MKRKALIASIALIVIGFISARLGDTISTVNESGMVQDSILMPIGAVLFMLGLLTLVVVIVWYVIGFVRGKFKNEQV
ncbi:MAG: DUF3955 domain-containing protein [Anaerolineaceae bacterium]|nr:DUF3955 domain-containing protein [Anaerolineaceae bacterium]